jgi:hypothetical protein
LNFKKWLLKIRHIITCRFKKEEIHIDRAQLSGDGSFIDIRYHLSRPDKVQGVFEVFLMEEETGKRFELMRLAKFGTIQTKHNKYQNIGMLLFHNYNNVVRPDSMVTLVFGKLRAKHIKVR